MKCPICGCKLKEKTWYDGPIFVEDDSECSKCGYHFNYSYGATLVEFGQHSFGWTFSVSIERTKSTRKKIKKAMFKYRKELIRHRKIKGRGYVSSF